MVLRLLGEIHAHSDPPEAEPAAAHYQQALALAEELGMRPLQAHCHQGMGTLYAGYFCPTPENVKSAACEDASRTETPCACRMALSG